MVKQAPVMSAMFANSTNPSLEIGSCSGSQTYFAAGTQNGPPFQQMPQLPQFSSCPPMLPFQPMSFPQPNGPFAYVTQIGLGTYNNFRGNQFKPKGKGEVSFWFSTIFPATFCTWLSAITATYITPMTSVSAFPILSDLQQERSYCSHLFSTWMPDLS